MGPKYLSGSINISYHYDFIRGFQEIHILSLKLDIAESKKYKCSFKKILALLCNGFILIVSNTGYVTV